MRISLSTLRKIIRESVESAVEGPGPHGDELLPYLTGLQVDRVLRANTNILDLDGGVVSTVYPNGKEDVYIVIPEGHEDLYEQINSLMQENFGRFLNNDEPYESMLPDGHGPGTKYLVDCPLDGQTGGAGTTNPPGLTSPKGSRR